MHHSLEVALVSVHDDVFVTLVVLMGHLLSERLDGPLHEGLFSINVEQAISLVRKVSELVKHNREGVEHFEVLMGHTGSTVKCDLLQEWVSLLFVKSKQVGVGIHLHLTNLVRVVILKL